MSAAALVLLMELPLVGRLTTKVQGRHLVASMAGAGLHDVPFNEENRPANQLRLGTWLRILAYIPLGFIFIRFRLWQYTEFREKE